MIGNRHEPVQRATLVGESHSDENEQVSPASGPPGGLAAASCRRMYLQHAFGPPGRAVDTRRGRIPATGTSPASHSFATIRRSIRHR